MPCFVCATLATPRTDPLWRGVRILCENPASFNGHVNAKLTHLLICESSEINNSINFYRFAFGRSQLQINRKAIAKGHKSKENEYENGNGNRNGNGNGNEQHHHNKKKKELCHVAQRCAFSVNGSAPVEFLSTASYIYGIRFTGIRISMKYIWHMANFAVHFRIVFHLPQPQQQNVTKLNYGAKQPSGKLIRRPFLVVVGKKFELAL